MLIHVVMWKYRPEVEPGTRTEHVQRLLRLDGLVTGMINLRAGHDVVKLPRSHDTALVITFEDREALNAYDAHPHHQAIVQFGKPISEHVASVDFDWNPTV